jgi:hypothetical protein
MYFCTLFDSNYISKGIALYLSLSRYIDDFLLYVMAMDNKCFDKLTQISFDKMRVEFIRDIEDEELLKAKQNRSRAEYCWTCGSVVTEYFFRTKNLPNITYLDSDLQFFSSPKCIEEELIQANASIGITPHFIKNTLFGKYCVQYVYFRRDKNGKACLEWWKDQCLKWCYSKIDNGRYGDQKYLDYFDKKFNHVHSIENRGVGIANWNMEQYKYDFNSKKIYYRGRDWPIVFFHYNAINAKVQGNQLILINSKYFPEYIKKTFLKSYANLLTKVYNEYLGLHISSYLIRPQNYLKVLINSIWIHFRKNKIAMKLEDFYLRHKYSVRTSPYSERTDSFLL